MENNKYWFFGSKLNTALLLVLIVLMVIALKFMWANKEYYKQNIFQNTTTQILTGDTKDTYIYMNHGFSIELPKEFVPHEEQSEGGPFTMIQLPKGTLSYISNMEFWNKWILPDYQYLKSEKIGDNTFKVYSNGGQEAYLFSQGNVGYLFNSESLPYIKTFKFVGWSQEQKYSSEGISFSYSKDVTLNSFVASDGYTVVELKKKNSQSLVSIHYAKSATNGARNMFSCFEFPVVEVVAGENKFKKCSSNAEPSDTYVLSSDSIVINIITNNFEGGIKIADFIDLSSVRLN